MAIIPFFSQYPYTNFEQLNIDGLIRELGILHKDIQDEAEAREAADEAEAAAREAADQAEATAREAADQVLDDKITAEAETRYHDINELISDYNTEVAAREAADQVLDGKLTAEATAREAADQVLDNKITAEAETRYHDINELITDYNALESRLSTDESVINDLKTVVLHVSSDGHGGYDVPSDEANDIIKAVDPAYNVVVVFTQTHHTLERVYIYENGTVKSAHFERIEAPSSGLQFGSLDVFSVNISHDSSDDTHSITLGSISIKDYTRIELEFTSDNNVPGSTAQITTDDFNALGDCDELRYEYYINLTLPNGNKMVYQRIGVNYSNINAQDIYLNVSVFFMNDLKHTITVEIDKTDDPFDPAEWSFTITGDVIT